MSFTSNYNNERSRNFKMAVPKKRTSISKKRIRKNMWKKKGYWAALKAFSLAKSLSTGNSKSFFVRQTNK
nr:ribosomal protein L32 [Cornus multinervosa]YP_010983422.1 ribosomal protein L32 [Cornus capitata]WOK02828.1 ribosomal protein L32 [Cornus elliptica]WOK02913.1 ribosomal protein L32 [Cornus kousa]WOK02998.1 ribosomal protein L32 [Cornus hongkongensis subsp. ferruginea]WOK03084.1 ribosomal protein L32 [Cornus hongkongensis subsp. melanotricha]WOK03170.1 ribosomal protein L32 [Cornus hongkongensis subsp. tonkinensis]WOK03256.1 ribosomal protein L32 [Cornus hongkongensis subsp. elegans]WOK03